MRRATRVEAGPVALGALASALGVALLAPLPDLSLDALAALSWATSVALLVAVARCASPLDLRRFPLWVMLFTVGRLCLNVATTRAILTEARAGGVVAGVGEQVMGERWVVGVVFVAALLLIQLAVLSRGAERVAQVTARFALDALPGAQQALTLAVEAGLMHPEEARRGRERLQARAELCGALDGAMRFVKGDALASLALVGVNAVGGVAVGAVHGGLSLGEAWARYAPLTVGDAVTAQLPALLSAVAVGAFVSRLPSAGEERGGAPRGEVRALEGSPERGERWGGASGGLSGPDLARAALLSAGGASLTLALAPWWVWSARGAWLLVGASALALSALKGARWDRLRGLSGSREGLTLTLHPEALAAVGGARALLGALEGARAERGLPPRPLHLRTSEHGLPRGGYELSAGGRARCEGAVVKGAYLSLSAPAEGQEVIEGRDPRWGLRGWWRPRAGGLSAAVECGASEAIEVICGRCVSAWASAGDVAWSVEEAWGWASEAPEPLKSCALTRDLSPLTLTLALRALSAEGHPLSDPRPFLEALGALGASATPAALASALRRRAASAWVGPLPYVLIELSAPLDLEGEGALDAWGEREWARVEGALRAAALSEPAWVVLCAAAQRPDLVRRLEARGLSVEVWAWEELPVSLGVRLVAWVGDL
jgi:type III secretion protein V